MQSRTIPLTVLALVSLVALACGGQEREPRPMPPSPIGPAPTQDEIEDAAEDFDLIRQGFLEWYFETYPVRATELGVYDHAHRLPAMDRAGVQRRIEDLLEWLADLEQVRFDLMAGDDRYDYAVLEYGIRAELLELEEARDWTNDPGVYTDIIARGLAALVDRAYAPFATRAGALTERMVGASQLLEAARTNVTRPPRLWTEMAAADARGLLGYLGGELPARLAEQTDTVPPALDRARTRLVEALESHVAWLEGELLQQSTGTFRLGRYLLERKLLYNDHISLSLDQLERLNMDAISDYRDRVVEVAGAIDGDRAPQAIIDSVTAIGPTGDALVDRVREAMAAARDWTVESGVVPVPRSELPVVRAAPRFVGRELARMDGPGPFAPDTLAAYYTLNIASDGGDGDEGDRTPFNAAGLALGALHNTFPGHFVQQQYAQDLTDLRKVLLTRTFTGGWAHYATEMALDEGFSDDPVLRLEQLRRALQRHARWYAVVRIHAMDAPLDQVAAEYMEIAYADEATARREVLRATREPELLADALGRMQILELLEDYREHLTEEEETFSLPEFHTELLRLGLPFPLAREVLIPEPPPERNRRR